VGDDGLHHVVVSFVLCCGGQQASKLLPRSVEAVMKIEKRRCDEFSCSCACVCNAGSMDAKRDDASNPTTKQQTNEG